jgi:hypothetical protein
LNFPQGTQSVLRAFFFARDEASAPDAAQTLLPAEQRALSARFERLRPALLPDTQEAFGTAAMPYCVDQVLPWFKQHATRKTASAWPLRAIPG